MMDLKNDHTGDLIINPDSGDLEMIDEHEEIVQEVNNILNINTGELQWNRDIGIDFNEIIINAKRPDIIQSILNDALSDQLGVIFQSITINSIQIDRQNRIATLNAEVKINTSDGTENINIDNGGDDNSTN